MRLNKLLLISILGLSMTLSACNRNSSEGASESVNSEKSESETITPSISTEIEVSEPSLTLNYNNVSMYDGDTFTLEATAKNVEGAVYWKSSDDSIATVTNGVITAIKEGSVVISAYANEVLATCSVVVSKSSEFGFDYDSIKIYRNKTTQLNTTYLFKGELQSGKTIEYTSSDSTIVTVDANGYATGKKAGEATITAKCGELVATVAVSVSNLISIVLDVEEKTVHPNEAANNSFTITATVKKNGAKVNSASVNWSCIDGDALGINANKNSALITAYKCGNTAIVAEYEGEIATCIVTSYKTVRTIEDMEAIKNDYNGWYKLENDIDFSNYTWGCIAPWAGDTVPIEDYFGGTFDGQGYTLKNMSFLAGWHAGVFGEVSPSGVIKNVSVINSSHASSSNKYGSIAALNHGRIENVYTEVTMNSDSQSMWNAAGGLIATNHPGGILRNCITRVTASKVYNNCGALIGYNCGEVTNCYAICEDAQLPLVYTYSSDLGVINNSYVFSSEEELHNDKYYTEYDKNIWTTTGYSLPTLKTFANVAFEAKDTFLTIGNSYIVNPTNVLGIDKEWKFEGDLDCFDIYFEENGNLNITPLKLGSVKATVTLENGHSATTTFIGKNVVLVPSVEMTTLNYNNPRLDSSVKVSIKDEYNNSIPVSEVEFISENESIVKVTPDGTISSVSGGETSVSIKYQGDIYSNLIDVKVIPWIKVSTPSDLDNIRNNLTANYCLANDIDYQGNTFNTIGKWTASDLDGTHFAGTFDGNGYTISNLVIGSQGDTSGIWGQTTESSIIRNTNFIIHGPKAVTGPSGIVGFNEGIIENCYVEFTATHGGPTAIKGAGTIVGTNEFRGIVRNCIIKVDANIPTSEHLGSVCGLNQGLLEDTFAMVTGNSKNQVSTIAYDNGAKRNLTQYIGNTLKAAETKAIAAESPFGSFDKTIWIVETGKLPVLVKIA